MPTKALLPEGKHFLLIWIGAAVRKALLAHAENAKKPKT